MRILASTTLVSVVSAALLAGACVTKPTVTKERTTMTPQQIAEAGLICREMKAIDSNLPRTICASKRSWAAYDRNARLASEDLMREARGAPNAGRGNRN